MLLWPQCCTDGPGEPECPVASACCPCPRMLAESDWEGAAPQAASCLEGGSLLGVSLVCWWQLYLPRSAQHPVLWSEAF